VKPAAYSKRFDGGRSVPLWEGAGCPHNALMQPRRVATAAAMLADPSRAAIVLALMDGRSRSAKKLALDAGVTPQTASTHLKKLVAAEMLVWQGQGRMKHFRLAGADVAQAVEALSAVGTRPLPGAARELRFARCCYDHLAGQLGVAVTERLLNPGNTVLHDLGIDVGALEASRRPLFRCCTDWTERRPHVAGALGAALLRRYTDERWLETVEESRKLVVTPRGKQAFVNLIGIDAALFSKMGSEQITGNAD
jgi:DNA-binding transcriptional ArsR family regulator